MSPRDPNDPLYSREPLPPRYRGWGGGPYFAGWWAFLWVFIILLFLALIFWWGWGWGGAGWR